jgi:hypothetical protein
MTLPQLVLDEAEDLARALRDIGREERDVIAAGGLDGLERFSARRGAVLGRLAAILPPGHLAPGPVRLLLEEAQEEARQSLALLCALREEIGRVSSPSSAPRATCDDWRRARSSRSTS